MMLLSINKALNQIARSTVHMGQAGSACGAGGTFGAGRVCGVDTACPTSSARLEGSAFVGRNQHGQAIIEYVLILVVVLALGGLVLKLNEGFKKWGDSIVGPKGYMVCLLETGQLPGKTNCHIKKLEVTFSSGSGGSSSSGSSGSGAGGSGSGGSSGSSSSSGGENTGGSNSSSASNSSGSSSSGGKGTAGDVYPTDDPSLDGSNQGSSSSSGGRRGRRKGKSSSNENPNPDGNTIALNSEDRAGLGGFDNNSEARSRKTKSGKKSKKRKITFSSKGSSYNGEPGYAGQRHQAIMSGGWLGEDEQKKRNKPIPVSAGRGVASKQNTLTGTEKRSRIVINKKAKTNAKDIKVGKWQFGNIFRIVLIVCVIVAMVLLIGSQTYSVKKSMK